MIAFVNNDYLDEEKAVLKVGDLALQRGYAAFDFLRTKENKPLFIDDYVDRFCYSASQLRLQHSYTQKDFKAFIYELIKKNKLAESGIRIMLTGGFSPDSYTPVTANLILLQQPLQLPSPEKFEAGIKIITHQYQRDLPSIKSTNYLMGIWLQHQVAAHGAADVLYHQQGYISEFPRANVFMVTKDKKIVTPAENILKGVTRMKLLELSKSQFEVAERDIHLDEMKKAAEVFMTSTTKRILPICQVDDVVIGNGKAGPVSTLLNNLFLGLEQAEIRALDRV